MFRFWLIDWPCAVVSRSKSLRPLIGRDSVKNVRSQQVNGAPFKFVQLFSIEDLLKPLPQIFGKSVITLN